MKKSLLASTITLCTLAVSTAFTVQAEPTDPQPQTNQQQPSPEQIQNQLPTPPPDPTAGKDLVTIGDSYTANGPTPNPTVHSYTTPPREPAIGPNDCNQDQENWPRIAAQQKQWSLADYSCNGAQAKQVATYLKQAADNKDLGPNTKKLIISFGGLQKTEQLKTAIGTLNLPTLNPDLYTAYLTAIKNWLPTIAPNAELLTTTYQPLSAPGDYICPATLEANNPTPLHVPLSNKAEETLNNNIKASSQKAEIRTIDIHNDAKGHDTCNPDDNERWVDGRWAPTTTQNMIYHPTITGTNAIDKIIANQL